MSIQQVETPKTNEEEAQANKPLLNIQLPASMEGDPNAPLPIGRHNAAAQHNFQEVANVLLTMINNQKMLGMIVQGLQEKQLEIDANIAKIAESIKDLVKEKENGNDNTDTNANK